jgi:tetratricopeptide (TPR) repeat protein
MRSLRELFDAALQHHEAGRLDPAVALYEQAAALAPDDLPTRANLAIALAQLGRHLEASAAFERALALRPDDATLRGNLVITARNAGASLLAQGNAGEAAAAFRRALAAAPDDAAALAGLGETLAHLGMLDEAEAALRRALAHAPSEARLHHNLAKVLQHRGQADAAIAACRSAVALQPELVEAWCLLGILLRHESELDAARVAFEGAVAAAPDHAPAQLGLGSVLHDLGRLDAAIAAFRRAQALDPRDDEAPRCEAVSLLLKGDLVAGWAKFDARGRPVDAAPWQGDDLAGRTILIYAEQGLGDTLQFARFAPVVAARGGRVILQVQRPLVGLMRSLRAVEQVIPARQTPPRFDVQAPLMSVPRILGTSLATLPAEVPYLAAAPEQIARWAAVTGERAAAAGGGLRIGLVWAGGPGFWRDRERSMPVDRFAPLLEPLLTIGKACWFSLQVGPAAAHIGSLAPGRVTDLSPLLTDYSETAAAMANLDLLISVDTSIVHLAGALGKPVWVLVPFAPGFLWLLERDDSPWYPTMRLFRLPSPRGWEPAVARVAAALETLLR